MHAEKVLQIATYALLRWKFAQGATLAPHSCWRQTQNAVGRAESYRSYPKVTSAFAPKADESVATHLLGLCHGCLD